LFHVFIFSILILSIFIYFSIFMHLFIFSIFFFKRILVFLICFIMKIILKNFFIFVWLDAGPPVFPKDFFNRNSTKSPYFKEKKVKFARFRP
jgi:hypothetical protein